MLNICKSIDNKRVTRNYHPVVITLIFHYAVDHSNGKSSVINVFLVPIKTKKVVDTIVNVQTWLYILVDDIFLHYISRFILLPLHIGLPKVNLHFTVTVNNNSSVFEFKMLSIFIYLCMSLDGRFSNNVLCKLLSPVVSVNASSMKSQRYLIVFCFHHTHNYKPHPIKCPSMWFQ